MSAQDHLQPQQFYHGTAYPFKPGDVIEGDHGSGNFYDTASSHAYFTTSHREASRYADNSTVDGIRMKSRVFTVEPVGTPERDPEQAHPVFGTGQEDSYRAPRARVLSEVPHDAEWYLKDQ